MPGRASLKLVHFETEHGRQLPHLQPRRPMVTGFSDPLGRDPFHAPASSLGESDYRPGHGRPGGSDTERDPQKPSLDPARFDYPSRGPRRPYRAGQ
jgi:hypothetical protein